jgi:hypothetical protein
MFAPGRVILDRMEMVPIIIAVWIVVLCAMVTLEERERRPPMRYKAPAASMAPPRSRDSIPATVLAGAMAGLPPGMTSAAQ